MRIICWKIGDWVVGVVVNREQLCTVWRNIKVLPIVIFNKYDCNRIYPQRHEACPQKESSFILASQNIEDFLLPEIKGFTKPLFSIPSHHFLFNPGNISPVDFMDTLQVEQSEYGLIQYPERGICLYRCGNERWDGVVYIVYTKELNLSQKSQISMCYQSRATENGDLYLVPKPERNFWRSTISASTISTRTLIGWMSVTESLVLWIIWILRKIRIKLVRCTFFRIGVHSRRRCCPTWIPVHSHRQLQPLHSFTESVKAGQMQSHRSVHFPLWRMRKRLVDQVIPCSITTVMLSILQRSPSMKSLMRLFKTSGVMVLTVKTDSQTLDMTTMLCRNVWMNWWNKLYRWLSI